MTGGAALAFSAASSVPGRCRIQTWSCASTDTLATCPNCQLLGMVGHAGSTLNVGAARSCARPAATRPTMATETTIARVTGLRLLLAFGLEAFLFELGARPRAKPRPARRQRGRDVSTVAAVLERRDVDRDRVTDLDHVVAVAGAIHVVGAVTLELDVALTLCILDVQHELHVRIDGDELLDDTGDSLAVGEIELDGRMMRGERGATGDEGRRNEDDQSHDVCSPTSFQRRSSRAARGA